MDDRHDPQPAPGARSGVTGLHAAAMIAPPRVTAGAVITRRRTPALAAWRAGARTPAPAPGGAADLMHDHGGEDGLIVVHFRNRVHLPVSVLASEAGYDIETAWQAVAELLQCGFLTARPDGDGYDATIPGPGPGHSHGARPAAAR
jgi:hypothetical protein